MSLTQIPKYVVMPSLENNDHETQERNWYTSKIFVQFKQNGKLKVALSKNF